MKKIILSAILIIASYFLQAQSADTATYSYEVKDNQLEVTKTVTSAKIALYSYAYLLKQKESIESQKQKDNEQRDKEIVEIDALIAEAKKGGIDKVEAAEAQPVEIKP